jgi:hypothetical protein
MHYDAITYLGPRRFLLTPSLVFLADAIANVPQTSETGLQRVFDDQLVELVSLYRHSLSSPRDSSLADICRISRTTTSSLYWFQARALRAELACNRRLAVK